MGKKRTGVRAASASSIRITFTYQGELCRELIQSSPSESNLAKTLVWRNEQLLPAIKNGTFDYVSWFPKSPKRHKFQATPSIRLKQYITEWFAEHKANYEASSLRTNQLIVDNQLIPAFGKYPVAELKYIHIKKWAKKQNNCQHTLNNKITLLNQVLDEAVDDEIISVNPLYGKKLKGKKPSKRKEVIDPFSTREVGLILNNCKGQQNNLFHFAFSTGLRTSECIALTWTDIDWINKKVKVDKKMTAEDVVAGYPKTLASNRWVKLNDDVIKTLNNQKQNTYLEGKEIFHNPRTNKPWTGDKPIRNQWTTILKRAGVRYRYPYQTRHTFATLAATSGEPIGWVSKQMGHVDAGFTYKVYAGWIDEDAPEAGNKFASILKQKSSIISSGKKVEK